MASDKSVVLLVRDPLKKTLLSFEIGYWRFSEYLVSERLQKEGYAVSALDENALGRLWTLAHFLTRREWAAEYIVSFIQTAQLAFSRKSARVAVSWQGPGFVFAAIRKLLNRSRETKLIILMYYSYPYPNLKHRLIRFILNKILLDAATVVCITPSQEKSFATDYKLPPTQIRRITRGIDANFFTPLLNPDQTNDKRYILCPGEYDRDDQLLFEACRDLDIHIIRVTKEPGYAREILKLAQRMKMQSQVKVLIKVDANTLRALYRNALFVALPLNNDTHPAGLTSLLEAMACGKATIVTQGLTTDGYVQDRSDALYCQRHDKNDLKEKIMLLMNDPQQRNAIGQKARKTLEEKNRMEMDVGGLMSIIEELISS